MSSSGGRWNSPASISPHPRFCVDSSLSVLVSNDNKNEELNWGLFDFNNGIESPHQSLAPFSPSSFISMNPIQFLDSPCFPFNSNVVSSPTMAGFSGFDVEEEETMFSDFNFQPKARPASFHASSISANKMDEPMESQLLEWNVETQAKETEFSLEINEVKAKSVESAQTRCNFGPIQTVNEQSKLEDGYNWRKYGEKQAKGNKKPRSYFKCSYPNCPTKKKVEKDLTGCVTEIVYRGNHTHLMPQNTKMSSSYSQDTIFDHLGGKNGFQPFSGGRSVSFGKDAYEQGLTMSELHDSHENEPRAKRRKGELESEATSSVGSKIVQESRIVVQTKSDVDILDDGYKWRKYGQKVVKENPNPRSYYKCTYIGCPVRKLVERASHDLQVVITTYEFKHNHDLPTPRGGRSYTINQSPTFHHQG